MRALQECLSEFTVNRSVSRPFTLKCQAKAGWVHRNIKTCQPLLVELGIKIGDLGDVSGSDAITSGNNDAILVGSLGLQAPEVLKRQKLTDALDVFSIGAILFKLLLGVTYKPPVETAAGEKPVRSNGSLSLEAKDLLQRTLESDPTTRIKMLDLLVHPFLTDGPIPQSLS
ncbi:MAG: kinase-like domain-containing protein [Linnemannia elongata]|nr:MAG: kinase-like domain-containing protein [Linnemannia elongata]